MHMHQIVALLSRQEISMDHTLKVVQFLKIIVYALEVILVLNYIMISIRIMMAKTIFMSLESILQLRLNSTKTKL